MFAALEGPADSVALLNLSAEQQLTFLQVAPEAFVAALGGWGRLGNTTVVLAMAEEPAMEVALWAAWRNVASKSLLRRIGEPPPSAGADGLSRPRSIAGAEGPGPATAEKGCGGLDGDLGLTSGPLGWG